MLQFTPNHLSKFDVKKKMIATILKTKNKQQMLSHMNISLEIDIFLQARLFYSQLLHAVLQLLACLWQFAPIGGTRHAKNKLGKKQQL